MIQYFYTIPVLFMTALCMLFLVITNEHILSAQKKGFIVAFLGEAFIIVFEVLSIILNNFNIEFRAIHFISNYLGFLLTPILITFFASSIDSNNVSNKLLTLSLDTLINSRLFFK